MTPFRMTPFRALQIIAREMLTTQDCNCTLYLTSFGDWWSPSCGTGFVSSLATLARTVCVVSVTCSAEELLFITNPVIHPET
jgi:hypothetical protein